MLGPVPDVRAAHAASLLAAHPQVTRVDTTRLTRALISSRDPVLVPDLPGWLWQLLDERDLWQDSGTTIEALTQDLDELVLLWQGLPFDVVAASEESVPGRGTGRSALHAQVLGHVNARLSAASDRVHLIVGGRVVDLSAHEPALS